MRKVKEGYKMTELGEIPGEWRVVGTKDILLDINGAMKIGPFGSQLKRDILIKRGKKVYGQENIFKNDFTIGDRYISSEKFNELKSCELNPNDIVISMMGTVGKCAIVPNNIEQGIMDSHLLRLRIDNIKYSSQLLVQLISSSQIVKRQIKKLSVGGIMEGLSSKIIEQLKYPCPPIKEQQKIASILSTVDEHIEETESLIEKTKELKKGLMQRLLTKGIGHTKFKKTEVGEIPVEWEVKRLGELTEIIMGQSPNSDNYNEEGKGMPLFQGKTGFGDITPKVQRWCTSPIKISEPYDILISVRAPVGDVNINNIEACIGRGLAAIRQSNKLFYLYIFYFLQYNKSSLNKYSQGSTFTAINSFDLFNYNIPVPNMSEQKHISEIIYNTDIIVQNIQQKQIKLQQLKQALMQKLLTGKIRVKI